MALEGEMVDAASTAAERRMIMAKYIDREALVEWLKRIPLKDLSDGRGLCRVIFEDDFKRAIKKIPKGIIADVAPVRHGQWVDKPLIKSFKHTNIPVVECSACGIDFCDIINNHYFMYKFCPNCGADMRGSNDE